MIKQNIMAILLMIFSFSHVSYGSSGVTPLQCAEDTFCPVVIAFGVVLLGVSFSNDYHNYIMNQNEKMKNSLNSTFNSMNITSNKFGLNSTTENFVHPLCFLNQTSKNLQKRCNQRTKEELKFLEKQNWNKLSPAVKKRYKYFQRNK